MPIRRAGPVGCAALVAALGLAAGAGATAASGGRLEGQYAVMVHIRLATGALHTYRRGGHRAYFFSRCARGCAVVGRLQNGRGSFTEFRFASVRSGAYQSVRHLRGACVDVTSRRRLGTYHEKTTYTIRAVSSARETAVRIRGVITTVFLGAGPCQGQQTATFTGRLVGPEFTG